MKPYPALLSELLSTELSSLRQQMALTQEAMAERLRISSRAYSDLERGRYAASAPTLMFLFSMLDAEALDALVQPAKAVDAELPEGSFYAQDKPKVPQQPRFRKDFPYPVLVAFLYLVLGFCFNLWHPGWIIFLTVPLFYLPDSERGYLRLLSNPIMVTIIYLLLGCYCNLWHPGWIIFLLVPIMNAVIRK